MELKNVVLIPAIIVNTKDPLKKGRILVNAPTVFKGTENLPWVYPLTVFGNGYSQPIEGKKVWLWNDKGNYHSFRYMPFFELSDDVELMVSNQKNCEVVLSRNEGHDVKILYDDDNGLLACVEDCGLQVKTNGDVSLRGCNDTRIIQMAGNSIQIGDETEDFESAVKGDSLQGLLMNIKSSIEQLSQIAGSSPYTSHLSQPLGSIAKIIDEGVNNILSEKVKIN